MLNHGENNESKGRQLTIAAKFGKVNSLWKKHMYKIKE